jgi:hypothetical protein
MLRRGGGRGPRAWPRFELSMPRRWRRRAAPVIRVSRKSSSRYGAKPLCHPDPGGFWSETTTSRPRARVLISSRSTLKRKSIRVSRSYTHWLGAGALEADATAISHTFGISLNHLIGAGQNQGRNAEANRSCGAQIDDQQNLRREFYG